MPEDCKGKLFDRRYALGRELGSGGMADVHLAQDQVSGREVALKRLRHRGETGSQSVAVSLFEEEFHVLSELAHPRVVQVFDYGVVDELPYYTMELLDGSELAGLAPLSVANTCAVFRDICSVLALLHSRRLVYRDLNPCNVQCTHGGAAKLIDFGAMMPMGPTYKVIGAPGFVAPEIVHKQAVDGRADLYAAGCAMYFALTGRPPYGAQSFSQLVRLWQVKPMPISARVDGVPAELEELVTELLSMDPDFRPASAADVMDRLSAIGDLPEDDSLAASRAYLATPPLIGRAGLLDRARAHLGKALAGKGRCLLLEGPAGGGRTRMLDAVVLQARLAGAVVVQADATAAQLGDYGVVNELAAQLLDAVPGALELATDSAGVLGHALPALRALLPDVELQAFADPRERRPVVQAALQQWALGVCGLGPLVIAVDDVEQADEPSVAFLALLAASLKPQAAMIILTAEQGPDKSAQSTLAALREQARTQRLGNLSEADTYGLLSATFGDSPKLALVSDRLYRVSDGNPRDLMQLAQFLVHGGIVRYLGGSWVLPGQLDARDLPSSAEEGCAITVAELSPVARDLVKIFALSSISALSFEACLAVEGHSRPAELRRSLAVLLEADILRSANGVYSISRAVWRKVVLKDLPPSEARQLHARLAAMIASTGEEPLLHVHHLRHAERVDEALDGMVAFCEASVALTDEDMDAFDAIVGRLPDDWYALFEWAIDQAIVRGRSKRALYAIRIRLGGFLGLDPTAPSTTMLGLLDQLRQDVGLDLYAELVEQGLRPEDCLKQALEGAQARYEQTPEEGRVLAPLEALRPLARTEVALASIVVSGFDYGLLRELPSLEPVEVFSPVLRIFRRVIDSMRYRMAGRLDQARDTFQEVLDLMDESSAGLDPIHALYARLGMIKGAGLVEASLGMDCALQRADALATTPLMILSSDTVRIVHGYFDSRPKEADGLKRQQLLKRVAATTGQFSDGYHRLFETIAHSLAGDIPRLKEVILEIEPLAECQAGWRPTLNFARAEYQRLQGRNEAAEELLGALLAEQGAGKHQIWAPAAGAHLNALNAQGRFADASALGQRYLLEAQEAQLGSGALHISLPLVDAHMHLEQLELARAEADAALLFMTERNMGGLLLGRAHEVSAEVAIAQHDVQRARQDIAGCARLLRADTNRRGRSRCGRLNRELSALSIGAQAADTWGSEAAAFESELHSRLMEIMALGDDEHARCERALGFLIDRMSATAGAVFLDTGEGVVPVCSQCSDAERQGMAAAAQAQYELRHGGTVVEDDEDDAFCTKTTMSDDPVSDYKVFSLYRSSARDGVLLGLVVLAPPEGARDLAWSATSFGIPGEFFTQALGTAVGE